MAGVAVVPARAGATSQPTVAGVPAGRTTSVQWGIDTASYVYDVLAGTEHEYGKPSVFVRYVTTYPACNGHGLTGTEASDLFRAGISLVLLDGTAQCLWGTTPLTGPEGTEAGDDAVRAAEAIGAPAGVALYEDVEFDAQPSAAFLGAYASAVADAGYHPGFYAQTLNPADSYFDDAFCAALTSEPQVRTALYWASAPSYNELAGQHGRSNMPAWAPDTIQCAAASLPVGVTPPATVAWQYARVGPVHDPPVNIDMDEFMGTTGLWSPPAEGSFVEAAGQLYEIAGGAPLHVDSFADLGGRPQGATVTPISPLELGYLQPFPVDGTVLRAAQTGDRYVVTRGVAWYTTGRTGAPLTVDAEALDHAGQGGLWSHLAHAEGYWLVSSGGAVTGAGQAPGYGSFSDASGSAVAGAAPSPDGDGYWVVARDGTVEAFGDARFHGDLASEHVSVDDVVAIAPTADGGGYWVLGADGGVFCFGDARYHGSVPALHLGVHDVVGLVASPTGAGYQVVGSDGGVFAFGATHFFGSLPGLHVRVEDIRAILPAPAGTGYMLVGADGGAFSFGHGAPYHGSLPGKGIDVTDVVGLAITADGGGYWMAEADGTVFAFGDALPTAATGTVPAPVAAIVAS